MSFKRTVTVENPSNISALAYSFLGLIFPFQEVLIDIALESGFLCGHITTKTHTQ